METKANICPFCGEDNLEGAVFCGNCGRKLTSDCEPPAQESVCAVAHEERHSDQTRHQKPDADQTRHQKPAPTSNVNTNTVIVIAAAAVLICCLIMLGVFFGWFSRQEDTPVIQNPELEDSFVIPESNDEEKENKELSVPEVQQILYVHSNGSIASVVLSEWNDGEWADVYSTTAFIGKNGISYSKTEGDRCTPAGEFNILYYLALNKYDSALDFHQINKGDVWVFDTDSSKYNTLQTSGAYADWDSGAAEDMYAKFYEGRSVACIMFDYNGDGFTPGADGRGSDIFIDGVGSNGTIDNGYGDIRITASDMTSLLLYLDSTKHPKVIID